MDNKKNNDCPDQKSFEKLQQQISNRHLDLKATQQIQQGFIIEHSNLIILVISELTQDDQNLIDQISSQFGNIKNCSKQKKLIVVHNLKDHHRPNYVKSYIQELKKVFPLIEQQINSFDQADKDKDDSNIVYVDETKSYINHIIMVNSDREIREKNNKFVIQYLHQQIQNYQDYINFNVPIKLREYLNRNLQRYVTLKKESDDAKSNPQIKDFLEYNSEKQAIMLNQGYIIDRVKELKANVLVSLQEDCSYSIVDNDEKKERYLLVEIPGTATLQKEFLKKQGQFIITIQQSSDIENQLGKIEESTRKLDTKQYTIQICNQNELWDYQNDKQENLNNGIYKFVFTEDKYYIKQ
ncbi:DNA-directed RNA polymerase, omega subunit family protein (macronuclear) [Tetrahymena thermophila SB210]|uniref:DNA-directed RNA polymerase, omega subunit family protein n=1 Tax=Tetrahymena thermophila (strain SB210) TaxID=312017 RepID=Q22Z12_TETTS|nr:DNA-directed RNA polymerase, omega subunit family protein [Tetrahymena thermophila SB210]EAR90509.2 DNA-directed RNA polymerase, omega subunit family protein [Tetrahymena thermophila SB210]|eukprot:XP_001010754.2 DNA-directed RNA polymerase, omega subunit family protein [Tetrahymena thermophila SB210]